jgi:prevent-host-death family protein
MAVFHISREEAARDFDRLMARANKGDEVRIEENGSPFAVLKPAKEHVRLLSESLRILEERGSNVTLDDEFGRDLEEIINSHREPLIDPLNDPWA